MQRQGFSSSRRTFLRGGLAAGAAVAAPTIIPSSALGLDGAVPPSERIVVGGIGIGRRGEYDLGCFLEQPDVQFAAVCDVKERPRKPRQGHGSTSTTARRPATPTATSANCSIAHDIDAVLDRHRAQLARPDGDAGGPGRQRYLLREALHEEHRRERSCIATRCTAAARSSRRAPSGGTCRTSPLPANWPAPAGSASCNGSTPTRRA